MKTILALFAFLLFINTVNAQCDEYYINELISGVDDNCYFPSGSPVRFCPGLRGIAINGKTFNVMQWDGISTQYLTLTLNGGIAGTLVLKLKEQELLLNLNGCGGARTYSISLNKREYQEYTEKKEREQNYIIEQAKLKDRTTKTNINAAIKSNDFFKALVLLQDLNFEDGDLLSKINAGWLIEKTKLNDVYSTYLSQFNEYKREFETSESAFYLKHEDLIKTEEITINGEEAYLQRISKTVDPKTKEYRKKKFEDDSYLYIKKGDKHLLCPVGVIGNYFTWRYNYKKVSDI
jgi:hypothetical protein